MNLSTDSGVWEDSSRARSTVSTRHSRSIHASITYVYDAFGRGGSLAPGRAFISVSVVPFDDGALADPVEESARRGEPEGKRVARVRASYMVPGERGARGGSRRA